MTSFQRKVRSKDAVHQDLLVPLQPWDQRQGLSWAEYSSKVPGTWKIPRSAAHCWNLRRKKKCRSLQVCFCLKELLRPPLKITRLKLVRESGTWGGGSPPDLSSGCWQQVTEGKQCLSASPPREVRAPFQPVHTALSLESWQLGNSCRLGCFAWLSFPSPCSWPDPDRCSLWLTRLLFSPPLAASLETGQRVPQTLPQVAWLSEIYKTRGKADVTMFPEETRIKFKKNYT